MTAMPGVLGLGRRAEVDGLAAEQELAAVAAVDTGDDLDQRGLARAVLADQRVDRAGLDPEAAGPEGDDGAERLGDVAQVEDRIGLPASSLASWCPRWWCS